MIVILRDIRERHRTDVTTADEDSHVAEVQLVNLIEVLKLSLYFKNPTGPRGKGRPQLSHGKDKKNTNKQKRHYTQP